MVLMCERWPVELEFRRSSHSFSLTDVPLSLALIFASGTHAFVAILVGTVIALLLRRLPADQVLLQPRAARARLLRDDHRRPRRGEGRPRLRLADVGLGAGRHPARRRADDRPHHRGDRAHRGPRVPRSGPPDVRHGLRRHDHQHGAGAGLQHPLGRAPARRAAAAGADHGRVPRLPRLRPRAPGPREGQVPLRGQPDAVRVARGRGRPRGPARARARGLPGRAGRGDPVRLRRRRAAADRPRPGHRARGDGARRRRRRHRAARARRELRRRPSR